MSSETKIHPHAHALRLHCLESANESIKKINIFTFYSSGTNSITTLTKITSWSFEEQNEERK